MRRARRLTVTSVLFLLLALPAGAAIDLGDGICQQDDGQFGAWNGTYSDDSGCVTPAEYAEIYAAANLIDAGVIDGAVVNTDGTTTLDFGDGVTNVVASYPLDRPASATPSLEPDAPTVGEVLYGRHYPV